MSHDDITYSSVCAAVIKQGRENGDEYTKMHDDVSRVRDESVERLESLLAHEGTPIPAITGELQIIEGANTLLRMYYYDAVQGLLDVDEFDDHLYYAPDLGKEHRIWALMERADTERRVRVRGAQCRRY